MSFSALMELNEYLRLKSRKWHIPIINDFYVIILTGALRRFLKHGMEDPKPCKIICWLVSRIESGTHTIALAHDRFDPSQVRYGRSS